MTATLADANQLFLQGTLALAQVERNGIRIDTERLDRTILKIGFKIDILNKELIEHETADIWRKVYGNKTNFGSREQLGKILFNHLNYEYKGEKTKTDRYRADDEIVRETGDKFAKKILEIEHLKKTRSTYLGGIKKETVDGFLHAVFNLHFVTTFRSSSDSPNFQNIPIRDVSIGRMIRKLFVPREKRVLIEIDFQASEFKGAAAFWRDPKMVAYASDPTKDIHRDMAMKCYCLEKDQVSKDARYCAKNGFVFPRLYGSFHKQIARHMWDMIDEKHLRAGKEEIAIPMRKHLQSKGILELGECNPKGYAQPKTFEYHIKSVEDWFDKEFNVFRDSREKWITDYRKRGWF